jgi:hypothetical protein
LFVTISRSFCSPGRLCTKSASSLYNYGIDAGKLKPGEAAVILTIEARDHASGTDIFDVRFYGPRKILPGMTYQDAVSHDENGRLHADLRK